MAMATGHTLFNVKRAAGRYNWRNDSSGIGSEASIGAVRELGFEMIYLNRREMYHLNEVPTCVLTVPSLNYKGRWHAVTWMNGEILDPNWGREGRNVYGKEWSPFTIGASGCEILLKPMSKIQYEDLVTLVMRRDKGMTEVIKECAA